jgi:hypothetical protein
MSSNVPPYRVDLIVAAAMGHSVFSSIGFILDIDGHCYGHHCYHPRKPKRQSIQEIYDCLGHHFFRCAFQMTYDFFWALHGKICGLIWYYASIAIYWKNRKRTGQQIGAAGTHPRVTNGQISSSARLG